MKTDELALRYYRHKAAEKGKFEILSIGTDPYSRGVAVEVQLPDGVQRVVNISESETVISSQWFDLLCEKVQELKGVA